MKRTRIFHQGLGLLVLMVMCPSAQAQVYIGNAQVQGAPVENVRWDSRQAVLNQERTMPQPAGVDKVEVQWSERYVYHVQILSYKAATDFRLYGWDFASSVQGAASSYTEGGRTVHLMEFALRPQWDGVHFIEVKKKSDPSRFQERLEGYRLIIDRYDPVVEEYNPGVACTCPPGYAPDDSNVFGQGECRKTNPDLPGPATVACQ